MTDPAHSGRTPRRQRHRRARYLARTALTPAEGDAALATRSTLKPVVVQADGRRFERRLHRSTLVAGLGRLATAC
ncbi:MAG TPA: hypothetical protein PKZ67_10900 [Accumulibacter sp.]|uniref:Uncharacterized protein n=1 Tax=Candidatus Accumulibacter cognatus TaxID=2954383 RepID=A0A7D5SB50_9PROT|nr:MULTISPECIES: hypothetical protein [Candidatus Accumulibacter]QLH49397.1 MAG: hypothetical protein HWD57_06075 [Candidatus Accumulibacter cognatus]MBL8402566.1 hypothetical protein [Accumulibacter sp.]MBN8520016.1 hypothetical protein [Accumulibacter sp.]MBO3711476.1 hypothetical protein [Accumulibacter sp.]MCC2866676.1 hypothetical protein [Candidatus Accumulibacter phosphatis]